MMEAYALIAGEYSDTELVAVYLGKQAGATKAAKALTLKRQHKPADMRDVRTEPIDVVATDGATR